MSNEYFDKQAAAWNDNPVRRQLTSAIADFLSETIPLNKEFSVLDYGCGTGLLSFLISDKVSSVCAVDISDGMLAEVRKKIITQNVKNIQAVNFDITKDKPLNRTFDLITSAMAMHHIEDTFAAITKLSKLLNPGGWIALADLYAEDGSFHQRDVVVHNGFAPEKIAEHLKSLKMTSVIYKNVFEIPRNEKFYPVFCVCARKI
ncbi:MAG: class I SAM-dependent methyltransferase [Phycisphaerae bacterium]|jgi:2-polyprenyl-3-methyl-5-hydroxy-6-metoxy-1,4-benzoquinol methylase